MTARTLRNRVLELLEVPASLIDGMAENWRDHPERQRRAVGASLEELGIYEPLIVRRTEGGRYSIPDGHLRTDIINADYGPETLIPIAVTDLTEEEARQVNATHDPLATLAKTNAAKRAELLSSLTKPRTAGMQALLDGMAKRTEARQAKAAEAQKRAEPAVVSPRRESAPAARRHPLAIVLDLEYFRRWNALKEEYGVKSDRRVLELVLDRLDEDKNEEPETEG